MNCGKSINLASYLILVTSFAAPAWGAEISHPAVAPAGEPKSATTKTLEIGAALLQGNAPVKGFDIYLNGFHVMKDHPDIQIEAHHYCHQINEDFAQCMLFDGNSGTANMHGVEYIISEKAFQTLPQEERKFWHPHNGEILSGQLVAPGIPAMAEHELMKKKMNSYGKTWHLWNTGSQGKPGDALPLGDPMLAWSFNRDGEAMPALIESRDQRLGINTAEKRKQRADLQQFAKPQAGVDDLKGKFQGTLRDIPGVRDEKNSR